MIGEATQVAIAVVLILVLVAIVALNIWTDR